jgi:[ribosomal protein S18]-alanine N-acetyltransferase
MACEIKNPSCIMIINMSFHYLEAVMDIEKEYFRPSMSRCHWTHELSNNIARSLIAVIHMGKREDVAGYMNFWLVAGEVQLNSIAVKTAYRRFGVADKLMQTMMTMAVKEGMISATLEVRSSNVPAIKLYEKFGFVVKGTRKAYYDDLGEDALIMWADVIKT